ncbi:hypothetical protein GGX14DRAFT_669171 [Mycena pura]|uniref:Uncharacterized protein n=1 Tax=Mycena pura TaxID=153505 RepID=A0AAD6VX47_9AGAR|nr:hypothetical protein GGX14DRAFT_669171 [Mycena pura]
MGSCALSSVDFTKYYHFPSSDSRFAARVLALLVHARRNRMRLPLVARCWPLRWSLPPDAACFPPVASRRLLATSRALAAARCLLPTARTWRHGGGLCPTSRPEIDRRKREGQARTKNALPVAHYLHTRFSLLAHPSPKTLAHCTRSLPVTRSPLHAVCRTPPASRRLPPAACLPPPASRRLPPAACLPPPASRRRSPVARGPSHVACRTPAVASVRPTLTTCAHCLAPHATHTPPTARRCLPAVSRCPLPASRFLLPASRFPLPAARCPRSLAAACHSPPLATRRPRPARPSLAHLPLSVRFTLPTSRWLRFPLAASTRPTHASRRPLRAAKTRQPSFSDAALRPPMPSLSPLARAPSSLHTPATALVFIFFRRARVHAQVLAPLIYVLVRAIFFFRFLHVGIGPGFVCTSSSMRGDGRIVRWRAYILVTFL